MVITLLYNIVGLILATVIIGIIFVIIVIGGAFFSLFLDLLRNIMTKNNAMPIRKNEKVSHHRGNAPRSSVAPNASRIKWKKMGIDKKRGATISTN